MRPRGWHSPTIAAGVRVLLGEVAQLDAARGVRLADGTLLPCDRLVLSPGVDFISGAVADLDTEKTLHTWKAGRQTTALRAQIEAMADGPPPATKRRLARHCRLVAQRSAAHGLAVNCRKDSNCCFYDNRQQFERPSISPISERNVQSRQ